MTSYKNNHFKKSDQFEKYFRYLRMKKMSPFMELITFYENIDFMN